MRFVEILVVCSDAVVSQMDEFVAHLLRVVVYRWKTHVALVVQPHRQRVEISYHYPLPNVKFATKNHQRILNIFLRNPQWLLAFNVVLDLHKVVVASNASSPRQSRWFQDPNIFLLWPFFLDFTKVPLELCPRITLHRRDMKRQR